MFRFTIRDVLWLTVVVAVIVTWRMDRRRQDVLHRREIDAIVRRPSPEELLREIFAKSKELGAPQPKPLPPEYGAFPNVD